MNVTLKKLEIKHFKGIKDLAIDFGQSTTISGANGSGKTTVFDAFTWVLFGKDSADRKDFNIKPLDTNTRTNRHLVTDVTATLLIDDRTTTIRKTHQEKWVKKRGEEIEEYTGNETIYYWNEVPLLQKDFQIKIEGVITENLFKLITNPQYFNSLKPADRRAVLINLAGEISDSDLAAGNDRFLALLAELTGKTLIEYKKELASKRSKIKDVLATIPPRIQELSRSLVQEKDTFLADKIETKKEQIRQVEMAMLDESKANEAENAKKIDLQNNIFKLNSEANAKANEIRSERAKETAEIDNKKRDLFSKIDNLTLEQGRLSKDITTNQGYVTANEEKLTELRDKYTEIGKSQIKFDDAEFICPTCKRHHDETDILAKKAEMEQNFKIDQARKLNELNAKGMNLKASNEALIADLAKIEQKQKANIESINDLKVQIDLFDTIAFMPINEIIEKDQFINDQKAKIAELELQIKAFDQPKDSTAIDSLKAKKQSLQAELEQHQKTQTLELEAEKTDKRITELKNEEKTLGKELSDIERMEFTASEFSKAKMTTVENLVNEKFSFVKFRLFEPQINGGEAEVCDALINGVPYADANNASKINAGIDIINTLCNYHNVNAPIFVDNSESVNKIIDSESQLIKLEVTETPTLQIFQEKL